jgi:acyl CoA:acetate/3-ketoacid CoA transferase
MSMNKLISMQAAAQLIRDGDVVTVSASSGLNCPDKMLAAIGERFSQEGHPRDHHAPSDCRGTCTASGDRPHRRPG